MQPGLARNDQRWQVEATGVIVADFMEIINPQTMTARMFIEGVVVEEYKVEQCDKCSQLRKFDKFGYQKGYDRTDNIIWFCGDCR